MEVSLGEILTYLLDTNIVSDLAKPASNPRVLDWLSELDVAQNSYLSVITIEEIREGISLLPEGRKRRTLESWLEGEVIPHYSSRILPITVSIADHAGRLMGEQRRKGFTPDLSDVYIAATALELDMQVATLNRKHFEPLGVPLLTF